MLIKNNSHRAFCLALPMDADGSVPAPLVCGPDCTVEVSDAVWASVKKGAAHWLKAGDLEEVAHEPKKLSIK